MGAGQCPRPVLAECLIKQSGGGCMSELIDEAKCFIVELDKAVEAHLDWTRRVMRCAVLHTSPGEDVLAIDAHTLCRFGHWFSAQKHHFEQLDAQKTHEIETVHQAMHDAIREICNCILNGRPGGNADVEIFERAQGELIRLMAWFKTEFLAEAMGLDPLTGLPMRRGIADAFTQLQKQCSRDHTLLYVGMIDVDHFKRVNDTYGHAVGDMALRHLVNTLKGALRLHEPLFRFGGEEFLVLMQCQSPEAAAMAAKRIVSHVAEVPMLLPRSAPLVLTVTLGMAQASLDDPIAEVVERADKALYAGKRAGRNRVMFDAEA